MKVLWVLVVVTSVQSGNTVAMHDFNTHEACVAAAKVIKEHAWPYGIRVVTCMSKGEEK